MQGSNFFNNDSTPPTAFYFSVNFRDSPDMISSFQEVSGLKLTLATEHGEDGDNQFIHNMPQQSTFTDLVLKRCLFPNQSLNKWCKNTLENFVFDPKDIHLFFLGVNNVPLASWNIFGAYPVSWELAELDTTSNRLAIETLVLKYRYFKKENS